ncbi:MAG: hypothetical protein VCF24_00930 [Candidatus Latescibacterota bacterium]
MGNPAIEELFLVLLNRNRAPGTRIHIYPCRFGEEENEKILSYYASVRPELGEFWDSMRAPAMDFMVQLAMVVS